MVGLTMKNTFFIHYLLNKRKESILSQFPACTHWGAVMCMDSGLARDINLPIFFLGDSGQSLYTC